MSSRVCAVRSLQCRCGGFGGRGSRFGLELAHARASSHHASNDRSLQPYCNHRGEHHECDRKFNLQEYPTSQPFHPCFTDCPCNLLKAKKLALTCYTTTVPTWSRSLDLPRIQRGLLAHPPPGQTLFTEERKQSQPFLSPDTDREASVMTTRPQVLC